MVTVTRLPDGQVSGRAETWRTSAGEGRVRLWARDGTLVGEIKLGGNALNDDPLTLLSQARAGAPGVELLPDTTVGDRRVHVIRLAPPTPGGSGPGAHVLHRRQDVPARTDPVRPHGDGCTGGSARHAPTGQAGGIRPRNWRQRGHERHNDSMAHPGRPLIVGGGIAGLSLAVAPRRRGFPRSWSSAARAARSWRGRVSDSCRWATASPMASPGSSRRASRSPSRVVWPASASASRASGAGAGVPGRPRAAWVAEQSRTANRAWLLPAVRDGVPRERGDGMLRERYAPLVAAP